MHRRLIVNADDLGLTVAVNDGIFDAHALGILTSASLFANAPGTADAVRRAASHPSLGIGAHLALVDGALAPRTSVQMDLIPETGTPVQANFLTPATYGSDTVITLR